MEMNKLKAFFENEIQKSSAKPPVPVSKRYSIQVSSEARSSNYYKQHHQQPPAPLVSQTSSPSLMDLKENSKSPCSKVSTPASTSPVKSATSSPSKQQEQIPDSKLTTTKSPPPPSKPVLKRYPPSMKDFNDLHIPSPINNFHKPVAKQPLQVAQNNYNSKRFSMPPLTNTNSNSNNQKQSNNSQEVKEINKPKIELDQSNSSLCSLTSLSSSMDNNNEIKLELHSSYSNESLNNSIDTATNKIEKSQSSSSLNSISSLDLMKNNEEFSLTASIDFNNLGSPSVDPMVSSLPFNSPSLKGKNDFPKIPLKFKYITFQDPESNKKYSGIVRKYYKNNNVERITLKNVMIEYAQDTVTVKGFETISFSRLLECQVDDMIHIRNIDIACDIYYPVGAFSCREVKSNSIRVSSTWSTFTIHFNADKIRIDDGPLNLIKDIDRYFQIDVFKRVLSKSTNVNSSTFELHASQDHKSQLDLYKMELAKEEKYKLVYYLTRNKHKDLLNSLVESLKDRNLVSIDEDLIDPSEMSEREICRALEKLESFTMPKIEQSFLLIDVVINALALRYTSYQDFGFYLNKFIDMMAESKKEIEKIDDKEIVLFIGNSGSGKSTAISHFLGAKLETVTNKVGHRAYEIISDQEKYPSLESSEFPIIKAFPYGNESVFCDCPGLNLYNKGNSSHYQLATNISIDLAIRKSKSIKALIITIPIQVFFIEKAPQVLEIFDNLKEQFPSLFANLEANNFNNIFILITKSNQEDFKDSILSFVSGSIFKNFYEATNSYNNINYNSTSNNQIKEIMKRKSVFEYLVKLQENNQIINLDSQNQSEKKAFLSTLYYLDPPIPKSDFSSLLKSANTKKYLEDLNRFIDLYQNSNLNLYTELVNSKKRQIEQARINIKENSEKIIQKLDKKKKIEANLVQNEKYIQKSNLCKEFQEEDFKEFGLNTHQDYSMSYKALKDDLRQLKIEYDVVKSQISIIKENVLKVNQTIEKLIDFEILHYNSATDGIYLWKGSNTHDFNKQGKYCNPRTFVGKTEHYIDLNQNNTEIRSKFDFYDKDNMVPGAEYLILEGDGFIWWKFTEDNVSQLVIQTEFDGGHTMPWYKIYKISTIDNDIIRQGYEGMNLMVREKDTKKKNGKELSDKYYSKKLELSNYYNLSILKFKSTLKENQDNLQNQLKRVQERIERLQFHKKQYQTELYKLQNQKDDLSSRNKTDLSLIIAKRYQKIFSLLDILDLIEFGSHQSNSKLIKENQDKINEQIEVDLGMKF